jgi:hypothetical protein
MPKASPVLVNHPGPLPISFEYTPTCDTVETIAFSGSVYTGDLAESVIGFELNVDGKSVGKSLICTNQTDGFHHATVPVMVQYDIPFVIKDGKVQPVTIELVQNDSDSLSNELDFFNVTIID